MTTHPDSTNTGAKVIPETSSPWHAGEKQLQSNVGVAAKMEEFGRKVIREFMPEQHREFYRQLPFMLLGTVDADGHPWATLLEGAPGFAHSPDPRTLDLDTHLPSNDPAASALAENAAVGLLGIELHTRRRNRINGRITRKDNIGMSIAVEHAFGNCPKYIQLRQFELLPDSSVNNATSERLDHLDEQAIRMIRNADTFFVASYFTHPDGRVSVDVSHRGGKPGFVKVEGNRLSIPDFSGNKHFNTLGNLLANPRAGLLFVDFESGDLLQLTGRTELTLEGDEIAAFQGAERLWHVEVEHRVRRPAASRLRWQFQEVSPFNLATGSWETAHASLAESRPPFPPFTRETAAQKVRMAEDGWNTRDPERVALAYTADSQWRNRSEFPRGRDQIRAFLTAKWKREQQYRLIKELWAHEGNRIAVRFAYEWHDDRGQWYRSYGNENWEFDENGLMRVRHASINDLPISKSERLFHWPQGRRPDDHPGLSDLGL